MRTTGKDKIIRYLALSFLLLTLLTGCLKNVDEKTDAKPNWVLSANVNKEFSMTYIVRVSISNEIQPLEEGDEFAAFIGTDCRGIASIVSSDAKNCFYMLFYSNQNDTEKLTFKFYSHRKTRIFESEQYDSYFPNQTIGSLDAPFIFEF